MENHYLKAELGTADRARALSVFQAQSPSKTVAARVIGNGTGSNSKVVFIDRGSTSGVESGMAVVTPDGIVGKVVDAYPTASLVMLITDPTFAAGVISQKNHVRGTMRGQSNSSVMIDSVENEQTVEQGEWFFTSGDDGIFPKGLPVGWVTVVRPGRARKEIFVNPSGFQNGLEDVLIVVEGVHAPIPDLPTPNQPVHLQAPSPSADGLEPAPAPEAGLPLTEADRLKDQYRKGAEGKFAYGVGGRGAPDFNAILPSAKAGKPAESSSDKSSPDKSSPHP